MTADSMPSRGDRNARRHSALKCHLAWCVALSYACSRMDGEDLDAFLRDLSVDEKVRLVAGVDFWHTAAVERLGIPALKVTDGPNGARGDGVLGSGTATALCIPCGSALGATWNPELLQRLGAALGDEAHSKAAHVLLAPTINIHRNPLAGRNFECYSEDPYLTACLAVALVRGVQSRGVATTPKHFVCNDAEYERQTISSRVGERALREIYLPPFEAAVREGGAWGIMAAYNCLNGVHCSEHERLLGDILRGEWEFDGFVVSDWFGTKSTVASVRAGLDLEMPGPPVFYGEVLRAAVEGGEVATAQLDAMVRRILRAARRTDAFAKPRRQPERSLDLPEHRALAREAAVEATVLLKNELGVLPLAVDTLRSLALIGPNADRAQIGGGGSASLRAHYRVTPLEALRDRLPGVSIQYEQGCATDKVLPPLSARDLRTPDGTPGILVEYFANPDLEGEVVWSEVRTDSKLMWFGEPVASARGGFSARARATYVPGVDGRHELGLITTGHVRLLVDETLLIDAWSELPPRGEALFGFGSVPVTAAVDLVAGRAVEMVIEYSSRDAVFLCCAQLGCGAPLPADALERAARTAAMCDAAVVVVGTNDDWESEGFDRVTLDLPGEQNALVERVAAANPRTVVVINAGAPVAMPWVDRVAAIVDVWFGGQEMAHALAAVLCGDATPSGKLPTTFPRRLEDSPSFLTDPGENGEVVYGEGVFVGYRYYDARKIEPLFPYGHGLSYTRFQFGAPRLSNVASETGRDVQVELEIANVGGCSGSEVVQVYVRPVAPRLRRPPRELKAFAKVALAPGERRTVHLTLPPRAFSFYDPAIPGWADEPGEYELHVGSSSRDIRQTVRLRRVAAAAASPKSQIPNLKAAGGG
jgi:beta-glucosidase